MLQLTHAQTALFDRPAYGFPGYERNCLSLLRSGSAPEEPPHKLLKSLSDPARQCEDRHETCKNGGQDSFKKH